MIGVRYEKYDEPIGEMPFSLSVGLERTPLNCSTSRNWHENPEIQLFTEGEGIVILNGEKHRVTAGDIAIVNSNDIHYTYTEKRIKYDCLIIGVEWCKRMGINYELLSFKSVIQSEEIRRCMRSLASICDGEDCLRVAKANELLLRILIEASEKHSERRRGTADKNKSFETIKSTVGYIQMNFDKKLSLDEIAAAVFYDKYALCKEFKKYTGQTIIENLNRYRVKRAKEFLKDGYTVTETAYKSGFENLSFFTKVFKKYTGDTPSNYKSK